MISRICPPEQTAYIKLKSKQRALRRINSKINGLNKYYNKETELFARFVEQYFLGNGKLKQLAPNAYEKFDKCVETNKIPEFSELSELLAD